MTDNVIQPAGIREVAVIGLGLMGSGIAELVARSGRRVVAIEVSQDFLDQGMARLHASLDRAVSRGKLTETAREEILARIRPSDSIAAGVANADLVIEAIPERMDLKRTLYAQLDEVCRPMRSWPPTPPRCRSPRSRAAPGIRPGSRGCTSSIPRR